MTFLKRLAVTRPSRKIIQVVITDMKYIHNDKQLVFWIDNPGLLTHKAVVKSIFKALKANSDFKGFGRRKAVIIQALIDGQERSFHQNVLINNQTNFKKYWSVVEKLITTNYDDGYPMETINEFKVRVWNLNEVSNKKIKLTQNAMYVRPKKVINNIKVKSVVKTKSLGKRSFSTSCLNNMSNKSMNNPLISPLKAPKSLILQPFITLDIETMNFNGDQIPALVSIYSLNDSQVFIIDHNLLKLNSVKAIDDLWKDVFTYINLQDCRIVFVHNLGKFDGIFIFKYLLNHFNKEFIKPVIDQNNSFVCFSIKLNHKEIKFLDSMRIFPVSLDNLCKTFGVDGKTNKYKPEYNKLNLFENSLLLNEWLNYSRQDSIALFKALIKAQSLYFNKYKIDLTSIVSISSLSFKIFRQDFLESSIPILSRAEDSFIRESYSGGSTDYFRKYLSKGYWYDINSLYPFAMLNPMPHKIIKFHSDLTNFNLEELFGFFKVEITTPKKLIYPLLSCKKEGLTIHPTGRFIGVYFSEELKAVQAQGYKIKLIEGYEFSKINLFESYINHFFNIKKISKGAERFISKLHLNTLYGFFGRSFNKIETLIIDNDKIERLSLTQNIKNIYEINSNQSFLLINDENINNKFNFVKSNVAIASAVTAYARVEMVKIKVYCLKNKIKIFYSDTDCIFTDKPLPSKFVGDGIGLFKDEMDGIIIEEAYFLGVKQYGYWFYDKEGTKIERSVFAGIPRDSITFNEVISLSKGKTLVRSISNRFFKSLNSFKIKISDSKITIKRSENKVLKGNVYYPQNL